MDVRYEDKKLHDDGIFDSLMGYKEWFHFLGTFFVDETPLSFMLGFPRSYTGMGAFGWIAFQKKQYSLVGNPDQDKDGFFDLQRIPVKFRSMKSGYELWYVAEPQPRRIYHGMITGEYPHYALEIETPLVDIEIDMKIELDPCSIASKEVFQWMPCNKRIASWFHSGDVTASLKGTIGGEDVTTRKRKNRGWYERMWSKISVCWPSKWLWFMSHLSTGAVLDLYIATTGGIRVRPFNECWLYMNGTFHPFREYTAAFPDTLEAAIRDKKYRNILGEKIHCTGHDGDNSFDITAEITDFRQYEYNDYSARVKYTNFFFETTGTAVIDGTHVDLEGRGAAERAPMLYWWI
ncbi:MAG: hypothetical protein HXS41_00240 [Theionarchaea archaeon]|nr:hypothetical protein [Theionarchaea archaeon]MBU7019459.1 hypothetical protein [Theionarchaea archaeon]MBU7035400.1 hypothetical protein [Theionarchaea archaeon]MBU7041841.1 hypothetical protein [Theionarchaea archaeon]